MTSLKGLSLSKKFYNDYFDSLFEGLDSYKSCVAVGMVGKGSECFGFDDDISRDHDFKAGFCLWLTDEDDDKIGFKLMRAYSKLPKEYMGYSMEAQSILGNSKYGVHRIKSFYKSLIGLEEAPKTWQQWFYIPSYALAEATNGEVFKDELGEFSAIRNKLLSYYPNDVALKKLSAYLSLAAQSGQYNYMRCIKHGELAASQLAINEFVNNILNIIFILNKAYLPFYKWRFKALRTLPTLRNLEPLLYKLLTTSNDTSMPLEKSKSIENIAYLIIEQLNKNNLSNSNSDYLETHAIEVTKRIEHREIASLHLMDYGA
ncbi:MAG: DUF4037 domain-containing protein [Christensenellaceae bacterium]|nr:DUF4037 domain-containing protein [Christensenellaceae bacterium]